MINNFNNYSPQVIFDAICHVTEPYRHGSITAGNLVKSAILGMPEFRPDEYRMGSCGDLHIGVKVFPVYDDSEDDDNALTVHCGKAIHTIYFVGI